MFKKLLKLKLLAVLFLASLAFVVGGMFWSYFALRGAGGEPLIVHFNDIAGIDRVGAIGDLLWVAAAGLIILFMNFVLCIELEGRNKFLSRILAGFSLFFAILIFIGFAAIISVNG